jgi:hypothetical protein
VLLLLVLLLLGLLQLVKQLELCEPLLVPLLFTGADKLFIEAMIGYLGVFVTREHGHDWLFEGMLGYRSRSSDACMHCAVAVGLTPTTAHNVHFPEGVCPLPQLHHIMKHTSP